MPNEPAAIVLTEQALEQKRLLVEATRMDLELAAMAETKKVLESSAQQFADPLGARRDEDGRLWHLVSRARDGSGDTASFAESLSDLDLMRRQSRALCRTNSMAKRALSVMQAYTARGWTYQVRRRSGVHKTMVPDDVLKVAQRGLDSFRKQRNMAQREKEIVRRGHRDGEAFLHLTEQANEHLHLRWIEPGQVVPPANAAPEDSWGIKTHPNDVEDVVGYFVEWEKGKGPELVKAAEVLHVKLNVDGNVKHGEPSFWACAEDLALAEKMKRNGATITSIWSAIAYVRSHDGVKKESIQAFNTAKASSTSTNSATGQTENFLDQLGRPRIIDAPANSAYTFPTAGLKLDGVELMIQVVLRFVASNFDLPEWMLTAKNDSVNFASALVTEGPTGMAFGSWHDFFYVPFVEINDRGFRHAVRQGMTPGFSPALLEHVEVVGVPPNVSVREIEKVVQADSTLRRDGVLSPQSYAARHGLEYQDEQAQIEEHIESMGGVDPVLGGLVPGDPGVAPPPTMSP